MFKKLFLYLMEVAVTLLVVFGVLTAIPGHASANAQAKGIGQIEVTDGYQVDLSYKLDPNQPDQLGAVLMQVNNQLSQSTPSLVFISVDDGQTWHSCSFTGNSDWECSFSADSAPGIEDIYSIRVVVS